MSFFLRLSYPASCDAAGWRSRAGGATALARRRAMRAFELATVACAGVASALCWEGPCSYLPPARIDPARAWARTPAIHLPRERAPSLRPLTLPSTLLNPGPLPNSARETAKKFRGAYESPILVYSPTSPATRWTAADPSGLPPIPHTRVDSLEELLRQADIVSLHCPLFDETREMIGAEQLKLMKPTAVLINTARGGLVSMTLLPARTTHKSPPALS